jgi:hypothetical protein
LITEREDFFNSLPGVTGTTAATRPPAPRSPLPFSVLPGRCRRAGASIARSATPAPGWIGFSHDLLRRLRPGWEPPKRLTYKQELKLRLAPVA